MVQIADLHESGRIGDHQARALERDETQEQADTGGNRNPYRGRNAVDDHAAYTDQADDDEQAAGNEDRAQRHFPRNAHALHHRVGKVGVEAHAGCQGNRIICV